MDERAKGRAEGLRFAAALLSDGELVAPGLRLLLDLADDIEPDAGEADPAPRARFRDRAIRGSEL